MSQPKPNPTLIVATDFSPLSQKAADFAADLARRANAQLCLVHIVQPIENPDTADEESQAFHRELMAAATMKLEQEANRLSDPDIERRVELGARAATLVTLVNLLQPLMLVMGSSIHDWPATHRVGVSLQFLVNAPCPVLFVPQ